MAKTELEMAEIKLNDVRLETDRLTAKRDKVVRELESLCTVLTTIVGSFKRTEVREVSPGTMEYDIASSLAKDLQAKVRPSSYHHHTGDDETEESTEIAEETV
jgi:hypothetical protein